MLDWRSEIEIVFGSLSNTKPATDYSSGLGHEKLTQDFLRAMHHEIYFLLNRDL